MAKLLSAFPFSPLVYGKRKRGGHARSLRCHKSTTRKTKDLSSGLWGAASISIDRVQFSTLLNQKYYFSVFHCLESYVVICDFKEISLLENN